jgi:hypothetical protein
MIGMAADSKQTKVDRAGPTSELIMEYQAVTFLLPAS